MRPAVKQHARRGPTLTIAVGLVLSAILAPSLVHSQDAPRIPVDIAPVEVQASGRVLQVVVENPQSPTPKIIAMYDDRSRISTVKEYSADGRVAARAEFTYERFGLSDAKSYDATGKASRTYRQTFNENGLLTSDYEMDASGRVLWKDLLDPTDDSPLSLRRRFFLNLPANSQLAETSRFIACHGTCTKTELLVDGKLAATWTIYRDSRAKIVKDDIDYGDLSFSYRNHFQDGSTFEHNFSSQEHEHTYVHRDAAGFPVSVIHDPENGPRSTTSYQYDNHHLLTMEAISSAHKSVKSTFQYTMDGKGNWVKKYIVSPDGSRVVRRTIDYSSVGE